MSVAAFVTSVPLVGLARRPPTWVLMKMSSARFTHKGIATEFAIVSDVDVPVGKGGGGPNEFVFK